eukprot:303489-Chlamydomonas_euryale.AAC.1
MCGGGEGVNRGSIRAPRRSPQAATMLPAYGSTHKHVRPEVWQCGWCEQEQEHASVHRNASAAARGV